MASLPDTSDSSKSNKSLDKIDPITALQDDIDGLSLAMFEALRSLRDAVAPSSGTLGRNNAGNINNTHQGGGDQQQQADLDDLWHAYRSGDTLIVQQVHSANGGTVLQKREDFVRVHAKMEMEKDFGLVQRLADTVLTKSKGIDERVSMLPGMHRTKSEQMDCIRLLLDQNNAAVSDLEAAYKTAKERRDACRDYIRDNTCKALGLEEDAGS